MGASVLRLLAYLIGGFLVVAAALVLVVEPAQGALVAWLASFVLGILGSGMAAVGRLGALRRRTAGEQASAFAPAPEEAVRRAAVRHPGLGPGVLELDQERLRLTGGPVKGLAELSLAGLYLYDADLSAVASRPFWIWFARNRLRQLAAAPRTLTIPRRDVLVCAGFDRVNTGPELVVGYREPGTGASRWEAVFLAKTVPGQFPMPSDDPEPWVRALQPAQTAQAGRRQAAAARRRIHRRLALAAGVLGAAAAAIPLVLFIVLLLVLAWIEGNGAAALTAGLLVGIWVATASLIGMIAWWSYR